MKQLGYRAVMVLCFVALLAGGTALFCLRYVGDGGEWASSKVNSGVYENGRLRRGAIYDREGNLLYDATSGSYAASEVVRRATLHLVGDRAGNIASSVTAQMSDRLVGFSPLTGTMFGSHDLYLTLSQSLCAAAYEALGGAKGAVSIYNYQTGELLCCVSTPTFDPTDPPESVEGEQYEGVYLNRVFSGLYTPGSIFKIVTAAAALEQLEGIETRSFTCTGSVSIGGETITCPKAHGEMDMADAFARSCNGAFATLAVELGGETMERYFDALGLGECMDISGIRTAAGSYTVAQTESDLGWSGVGQYRDMVTPIAMLRLAGAIANEGVGITPRLLLKETGALTLPLQSESQRLLSAETAATLRQWMRGAVVKEYGADRFGSLTVCAKSGTAEVGEGERPHSWFVGFVEQEDLPLAFSVVVENGGGGSAVAGSIAAKLLAAAASAQGEK